MSNKKIVFIAKTNLNNDGRILNQLKILKRELPDLELEFILLADVPLVIDLGSNVKVFEVKSLIRHNRFLRFLTLTEFTIRSLFILFKRKPDIIHAHDTAVVLPVLLYKLVKGAGVKIIYDDHEMPNEKESLEMRLMQKIEVKLMRISDNVIFANSERMEVLVNRHQLANKYSYFLNLPYFNSKEYSPSSNEISRKLNDLEILQKKGIQFIIHQGILERERGRAKLASFSEILPKDVKILLLGGSEMDFKVFIDEYSLDFSKFYFVGSVSYLDLPKFWKKGAASIVMYLPTYINNRLCAPNRLYISVANNIPVFVNRDNPVLFNFISKYNCGFEIENYTKPEEIAHTLNNWKKDSVLFSFDSLKDEQIMRFISNYK